MVSIGTEGSLQRKKSGAENGDKCGILKESAAKKF